MATKKAREQEPWAEQALEIEILEDDGIALLDIDTESGMALLADCTLAMLEHGPIDVFIGFDRSFQITQWLACPDFRELSDMSPFTRGGLVGHMCPECQYGLSPDTWELMSKVSDHTALARALALVAKDLEGPLVSFIISHLYMPRDSKPAKEES